MHLRFPLMMILLLNSACSTVIEGRTQRIAVDTLPIGAECVVKDNDLVLARVRTPGTATVEKSKNDILVECTKEGYIPNKLRNKSDMALTSMANMAFGQWSFIGNAVDSASGASHKYDSRVFMALNPLPPVALAPAPGETPAWAPNIGADDANARLARQISQALGGGQPVVVSHRPVEEILQRLARQQSVEDVTSSASAGETQVAAVLPAPIFHNAD